MNSSAFLDIISRIERLPNFYGWSLCCPCNYLGDDGIPHEGYFAAIDLENSGGLGIRHEGFGVTIQEAALNALRTAEAAK